MKNLNQLFEHELKDLCSAEQQLCDALPKVIDTVSNDKLRTAFENHLQETKGHLEKVQAICNELNLQTDEKCKAMEGLVKEAESMISEDADADTKDAGLIACAQRIEHYEIAGYGTARHYAKRLGHDDIASRLSEILEQEKDADEKLNDIAIESINEKAMA